MNRYGLKHIESGDVSVYETSAEIPEEAPEGYEMMDAAAADAVYEIIMQREAEKAAQIVADAEAIQAEETAAFQAARASAGEKLAALGLTPEEVKALVGG